MYRINWPNRVSLARLLLVAPFVDALLHLLDPRWTTLARWSALLVFAVMALSDGLDGFLARRLHQETPVGRFLDPLADKILIFCSVLILAHQGRLPITVAVIAIAKDLIVVLGFTVIYLSTGQAYIDPRRTGKLCTALQLLMIMAILLAPSLPPRPAWWVQRVFWWSASGMAIVAAIHYYQLGRHVVARHEAASSTRPEKR